LAFAAYLRHIGAPVEKHFRSQGLPTLCEDPNAFVPLEKAWNFFASTAQHVDPMLGWRVGQFVGDHNLNRAFLQKLENAPTLYGALKKLIRLSASEASHLHLGIEERGDNIHLFTHYPDMKGEPGYFLSQSYQIGVILGVIRHYAGKDWMPPEIGIEYPHVPAVAEELFPKCRIRARQRTGYIAIPRASLHLPPPRRVSNEGQEGPLILTDKLDYSETLRLLLQPYLPEGYPRALLAASLMDTSERTLDRRLSESGLTYRAVIDGLRFDEAKKLLEQTDAQIVDVAAAVGFEDPANFSRMFRRIGGLSPREFRRTLELRS
tara:strand:- start:246 stop:1205 length:960 start_codon:yes stop_codon:yes gene_type:complete